MLEIVTKRDSLIASLKEEQQRWCKILHPAWAPPQTNENSLSHVFYIITLLSITVTYLFFSFSTFFFMNLYEEALPNFLFSL